MPVRFADAHCRDRHAPPHRLACLPGAPAGKRRGDVLRPRGRCLGAARGGLADRPGRAAEQPGSGSTLEEFRKAFGTGRIRFATDAGGTRTDWLCYTLETATPRQRVWFSGSTQSAVQLPGTVVETVVVEALSDKARASPRCPSLSAARFEPVDLGQGAAIGGAADHVIATETPLKRQGEFRFEHRHFSNHHGGVETLWAIRVVDGRIVGLRASEFVRS